MRSRTAIVAFILSLLALGAAAWATISPIVIQKDAAAVQSNAKSLGELVTEVCAKGGAAAAELGPNGACVKAAEVQGQAPIAQPAPLDPGALRQAARAEVVAYCASHNGCRGADGQTPDFDLIVDAVVAKIPAPQKGADGADATAAQVADAVAGYCGQASEPCRGAPGTNGQNGQDGKTPTCVSEPSECRGEDGQPPAGWTTSYPDGSTGTCTRATPFEPAAPRYTCTRSAPPKNDPPLPLGG